MIGYGFADSPQVIQPQRKQNQIMDLPLQTVDLYKQAKMWGLTPKAFKHYLWLMKHTPSGYWYTHLDPPEILALNAKSRTEMMRYALIQAQSMHRRVSRELAFNKLYVEAYRALYPHEKAIRSPHRLSKDDLQSGDRLWLFVEIHASLSYVVYQHLIQIVQAASGVRLDIYFVGNDVSENEYSTLGTAS